MPDRFRTVVREHRFEKDLRALMPDAAEADEFVQAAEYLLARDPNFGLHVEDEVWFLPMNVIRGMQISLYYAFDDSSVYFLSLIRA